MADRARITREQALERLRQIAARETDDPEEWHWEADGVLLDLIDDREITAAYNAIEKWYA